MKEFLSQEIKMLKDRIGQLKELREVARQITDTVACIEEEINQVDESMPNPRRLTDITDKKEREQLKKAEKLLREAYELIDAILGPPEDNTVPSGETLIPEAKGNSSSSLSIDDILKQFPSQTKKTVS